SFAIKDIKPHCSSKPFFINNMPSGAEAGGYMPQRVQTGHLVIFWTLGKTASTFKMLLSHSFHGQSEGPMRPNRINPCEPPSSSPRCSLLPPCAPRHKCKCPCRLPLRLNP